jgi:hypothetical protein
MSFHVKLVSRFGQVCSPLFTIDVVFDGLHYYVLHDVGILNGLTIYMRRLANSMIYVGSSPPPLFECAVDHGRVLHDACDSSSVLHLQQKQQSRQGGGQHD